MLRATAKHLSTQSYSLAPQATGHLLGSDLDNHSLQHTTATPHNLHTHPI